MLLKPLHPRALLLLALLLLLCLLRFPHRLPLRPCSLLGKERGGTGCRLCVEPLPLGLAALAQGGGVLCGSAVLRTPCPLDTQVVLRELRDFLVVRVLT